MENGVDLGCTSVSISGWVKNVFTDQRSNENTTASESWVIGTFAAKSWPYILKSCEPNPSVAYMHCMRNYLSLRVYLNNSLFPNQRGPNSSKQTFKNALSWLLLAVLQQACSSVYWLRLWRRGVCADSFMYRKILIVYNVST